MEFDDLLDDREAEPAISPFARHATRDFEDAENSCLVLRLDSRPVVDDLDLPSIGNRFDLDPDSRAKISVHVLNRVADQIRKELIEPGPVEEQGGRIFGELECNPLLIELDLQLRTQLVEDGRRIHWDAKLRCRAESGQLEHVVEQFVHMPGGLVDSAEEVLTPLIENVAVVVPK